MDGNNVKNDDKNGQLSCGIYSSPVAARLPLQRLGRRSLDSKPASRASKFIVGSATATGVGLIGNHNRGLKSDEQI